MKKGSILLVLLFALLTSNILAAGSNSIIEKQTYIYSIKGIDTLRLDRYDNPDISGEKPCLIYVFGGGFKGGNRSASEYNKFFNFLLGKGYQVVSIDYRLGLKNVKEAAAYPAALPKSINLAVEDLYDATNFILDNAKEWGVDTNMLIPCGSSAGAITVLHAEYAIVNKKELSRKLPDEFNYAGIISLAGAIFSHTGNLQWNTLPCPILLFHGDADRNVPFDKIEAMNMGFYGSKHIAEQLRSIRSPHSFYEAINAAHELSSSPIQNNLNEINSFLEQLVRDRKQLIVHTQLEQIGKPELNKDFELMDYINTNLK